MWIMITFVVGVIAGIFLEWWAWTRCRRQHTKAGTPSASHNTDMDAISQQYYELLYAVGSKFRNESRHQTALRYIREAESNSVCCGVAKQHHA